MSGDLLAVEHVTKTYRHRRAASRAAPFDAVDDVSFALDAERPEIFAIIGESGSGKTTLARMILEHRSRRRSGTIRFRGTDLSTVRGRRRRARLHAPGPADLPEPVTRRSIR